MVQSLYEFPPKGRHWPDQAQLLWLGYECPANQDKDMCMFNDGCPRLSCNLYSSLQQNNLLLHQVGGLLLLVPSEMAGTCLCHPAREPASHLHLSKHQGLGLFSHLLSHFRCAPESLVEQIHESTMSRALIWLYRCIIASVHLDKGREIRPCTQGSRVFCMQVFPNNVRT